LTIGTGVIAQVVGLDGTGVLVRASSSPSTNALTGGNNCIVSNVNGNVSNLTPAAGTIAQAIGFDAGGVLVKGAVITSTTNTLTAASNNIVSTVNGIVATLTPNTGSINQLLGFNAAGNLVTSSSIINSQLTPGPNSTLKGTDTTGGIDDIILGPSMSMSVPNILNSQISFFNGSNPNISSPADRPLTSGVLYYGINGSTWYYNGSNYISNSTGSRAFLTWTAATGIGATVTPSIGQYGDFLNMRFSASTPGANGYLYFGSSPPTRWIIQQIYNHGVNAASTTGVCSDLQTLTGITTLNKVTTTYVLDRAAGVVVTLSIYDVANSLMYIAYLVRLPASDNFSLSISQL
jgi:hypothetical protein